ncbi:MAG TPA: hypothetical protein VGF61_07760 [Candidatus Acidoferrum sp.]|jgi:hypothetical protein
MTDHYPNLPGRLTEEDLLANKKLHNLHASFGRQQRSAAIARIHSPHRSRLWVWSIVGILVLAGAAFLFFGG